MFLMVWGLGFKDKIVCVRYFVVEFLCGVFFSVLIDILWM